MKSILCLLGTVLGMVPAFAQGSLEITTSKTTCLVFPQTIRHVDRGSKDILVQQVWGADHILLVKAAQPDFQETNISVITAGGQLYSFLVRYQASPGQQVYNFCPSDGSPVYSYAHGILDNNRVLHGIQTKAGGVQARLKGIYIKGDVLFLHLEVENQSSVDYDIDALRLSVKDIRKARRTASQEVAIKSETVVGNLTTVAAGQKNNAVIALPRMTLSGGRYLSLTLLEKKGERQLTLKLRHRKIEKAVILPDH